MSVKQLALERTEVLSLREKRYDQKRNLFLEAFVSMVSDSKNTPPIDRLRARAQHELLRFIGWKDGWEWMEVDAVGLLTLRVWWAWGAAVAAAGRWQ